MPKKHPKEPPPDITPGWHLQPRYYLEVNKHGGNCLFCDEVAGWKWEHFDSTGKRVRWLRVCTRHKTRLRPSDTDPLGLELNIPNFPRAKSISREELVEYLNISDRLFPLANSTPSLLKGFQEFTHHDLMQRLHDIDAVEPSAHAAGWAIRDHFLVAILHDDGKWEAIVREGAAIRWVKRPATDQHNTIGEDF